METRGWGKLLVSAPIQMQPTMPTERDEAALIRAAMAGDGAAFAELVRPAYDRAYRLAAVLLHDLNEAEDAVQEASSKAWRKLGNVQEGRPFRPWFLAIVENQCRSMKRTRWASVLRLEFVERVFEPPDVATSVDLGRAVSRLGRKDQLAVHLRFTLDLPYYEVGLALGVTEKGARTRVERAVQKLRLLMPEVAR